MAARTRSLLQRADHPVGSVRTQGCGCSGQPGRTGVRPPARLAVLLKLVVPLLLVSACTLGSGEASHFGGSGEVRRDHGSGGAPLTVDLSVVLQRGTASVEVLSPDGTKQLSSSLTGPATLARTLSFSGQTGTWLVVIAFQDAEGEYRLAWRE